MHNVIRANQENESFVYHWLQVKATFDVMSFPASVKASDAISSLLSLTAQVKAFYSSVHVKKLCQKFIEKFLTFFGQKFIEKFLTFCGQEFIEKFLTFFGQKFIEKFLTFCGQKFIEKFLTFCGQSSQKSS